MNEYRIYWTPFALRCLDEIYEFICSESKSTAPAQKFIESIFRRTDQLTHQPFAGPEEPLLKETGQGSRYLVIRSYKIIYQVSKRDVIITDIFHVKQNPEKIKRENK
jgi:plasmid stabilization system protein ParE